jgi:hypothetical protein
MAASKPGIPVLVVGTGGVLIFAVRFANAMVAQFASVHYLCVTGAIPSVESDLRSISWVRFLYESQRMQNFVLKHCLAVLLIVIGVTVSCARGQTVGLAGTWIINIQSPGIPHAEKVVLTFKEKNGVIEGAMNNDTPLEDIKVADDQLSFYVMIGPPGSPKVPFTGTIAGDELHLKAPLTSDGRLIDIVAERATPEELVALEAESMGNHRCHRSGI